MRERTPAPPSAVRVRPPSAPAPERSRPSGGSAPARAWRTRSVTPLARALRRRGLVRWRPALRTAALILVGVALGAAIMRWPQLVPWSWYAPLLVIAGLFLIPSHYVLTCLAYAACLALVGSTAAQGWSVGRYATIAALVATAVLMGWRSWSRERLGVDGNTGDDMLVDLRDRLRALGRFPALPAGWHAECSIRSAYGDKFSGDFAVTSLSPDGQRLEVVLVDLSGKGRRAGTRSLLLSGAVGGLLGQLAPERLLGAANSYLLRQSWDEGFASAVHVELDLATGDFTVGIAGHPGPFQFSAGSGRWSVHSGGGGPVLGILPQARFPRRSGHLGRGDAIVLYTDGVIESPGHDLAVGADRLMGAAERLVPSGFTGGARTLCASATSGETDDRAVVLIWRD